jgi:hypothetical protein
MQGGELARHSVGPRREGWQVLAYSAIQNGSSGALTALFLQRNKPEINFVHSVDIFRENGLISVVYDRLLTVAALEILNNLVQLIDFRMHDPQAAYQSHLLDI